MRQHEASTRTLRSEHVHHATESERKLEETVEAENQASEDVEEMGENEVASVIGDADGYESPADAQVELQNFPLSKARLNKNNIVYADDNTLCVRIKETTVCANLWK